MNSLSVSFKTVDMQNRIEKNNELAKGAINYARGLIKFCATIPGVKNEDIKLLDVKIESMRYRISSPKEKFNKSLMLNVLGENKYVIKDVKKSGLGNCCEYSILVMNYLRKQNVTRAEQIKLNGDHVLVVIDRRPGSDINDPSQWGDTAIICDAWANTYFHVSEIYLKLKGGSSNWNLEYPNYFTPYTKRDRLEVMFAIQNEDNNQQRQLVKRAIAHLSKVEEVISELIPFSEAIQPALKELGDLSENILTLQKQCLSNSKLEREINKVLRKSYDVITKLPISRKMQENLMEYTSKQISKIT